MLGASQPRRVRASEASHDIQLAEVALAYRLTGQVVRWESEQSLQARRAFTTVTPDALVTFADGTQWAVEGGGSSYSSKKLEAFHEALLPQLVSSNLGGYILV